MRERFGLSDADSPGADAGRRAVRHELAGLRARAHLTTDAGSSMAPGDAGRPAVPHAEAGRRGFRIVRGACPRAEFNAHRERLPRSVRRDVEVVPRGHIGLIVQALAGGDSPLLTVYGHVRADCDPADALAALEQQLRRQLR